VRLDTVITGRGGEAVADGVAEVLAPVRKVSGGVSNVPEILLQRHRHFDRLLQACKGVPPIVTAVVAPEEKASLGGALLAAEQNLIRPILIGSAARITAVADEIGANIQGLEIVCRALPRLARRWNRKDSS
jgi:phosphate butyryltransferase